MSDRQKYGLLQAGSLIVFLVTWELLSRSHILSTTLIPPPSSIFGAFQREQADETWSSELLATAKHYFVGVSIGSLLGIALGFAAALSPRVHAAQEGIARLLRPVPPLAWIPFAIIWFGITETAAAFIIAIGCFWVNYFAAFAGAQSVDRRLFEVCDVYGQGRLASLTKVLLPGAAPSVLAGIRSGLGVGWFAVLAAELFGIPGLGQRMMEASGLLATDIVLLYMATIAVFYTMCDTLMSALSSRVLRWMA